MGKRKTRQNRRDVYDFYEEFIKVFNLYKPRKNKVDFKPLDMVRCTYIEGLFKVVSVETYYLTISPLNNHRIRHYVGFEFIEKVEHNPKVIKVLFDE